MNAKPKIIFITAILTIIMLLNTVPSIAQGEKVAYILKNVNGEILTKYQIGAIVK